MTDQPATDHAQLAAELAARSDAPEPQADATETEARKHGWMSPDEREADPKYQGQKHRSASEFLEIMEDRPAVHKERNKALQSKIENLERTMTEGMRRMEERVRAEEKAKYASLIRDAVRSGDEVEADRLIDERDKAIAPDAPTNDAPPEVKAWVADNKWFEADADFRLEAIGIHNRIAKNHPAMNLTDQLSKVKAEMQKRYPKEFGVDESVRPAATSLAEGARLSPRKTGRGDQLPSVALPIARKLIAEGAYKDLDAYAAVYFADEPERARA